MLNVLPMTELLISDFQNLGLFFFFLGQLLNDILNYRKYTILTFIEFLSKYTEKKKHILAVNNYDDNLDFQ